MKPGIYQGGAFPELAGKRALLQERADGKVVAQFDDLGLAPWCFGWHEFLASDFRDDQEDQSSWCGNDSSPFRHLYDKDGL